MPSPPRCRGARRAWRRWPPRGGPWRSKPRGRPRPRGRVGPRRKRSARARGSHVEVERPSPGMKRLLTKRRGAAPMPRAPAGGRPPQVGMTVGLPKPVWMRRRRGAWPVTCRMPRPLRSRPQRWPRRAWRRWSQQGLRAQGMPGVRLRRAWRRGTRGLTVRPPPRHGRRWGWTRPERPVVGRTMPRRQSPQRRPPPPGSAWRPQCAAR
jgi:hypothetical protein